VLERVAGDAGCTRGALYHHFAGKTELALAVVAWVEQTWYAAMAPMIADSRDAGEALVAIARAHALLCRRDIARVMMTLRVEFSGQDHPVGRAVEQATARVVDDCTRLISTGRRNGSIPPGPPARMLALALVGAIEGLVINLAGKAPYDVRLAERTARGLLGLAQAARGSRPAESRTSSS
jgi:AcrR family transcriptional regulator